MTVPLKLSQLNTYRWHRLLKRLMLDGSRTKPRGQDTFETLGVQEEFLMQYPVIACAQRKLNLEFMIGEAHWVLSGANDTATPASYMAKFAEYSDNGIIMAGAYGPAVNRQLAYVVRTLMDDPHSRQAVISIWHERPEPSKDIPCTVSLQFFLRQGSLHCVANMRSSDAYLGLPYDIFTFSCIAAQVAHLLHQQIGPDCTIELGYLTWQVGSAHIYDRDVKAATKCVNGKLLDPNPMPLLIAMPGGIIENLDGLLQGSVDDWVGR